jgi:hypothetical protein
MTARTRRLKMRPTASQTNVTSRIAKAATASSKRLDKLFNRLYKVSFPHETTPIGKRFKSQIAKWDSERVIFEISSRNPLILFDEMMYPKRGDGRKRLRSKFMYYNYDAATTNTNGTVTLPVSSEGLVMNDLLRGVAEVFGVNQDLVPLIRPIVITKSDINARSKTRTSFSDEIYIHAAKIINEIYKETSTILKIHADYETRVWNFPPAGKNVIDGWMKDVLKNVTLSNAVAAHLPSPVRGQIKSVENPVRHGLDMLRLELFNLNSSDVGKLARKSPNDAGLVDIASRNTVAFKKLELLIDLYDKMLDKLSTFAGMITSIRDAFAYVNPGVRMNLLNGKNKLNVGERQDIIHKIIEIYRGDIEGIVDFLPAETKKKAVKETIESISTGAGTSGPTTPNAASAPTQKKIERTTAAVKQIEETMRVDTDTIRKNDRVILEYQKTVTEMQNTIKRLEAAGTRATASQRQRNAAMIRRLQTKLKRVTKTTKTVLKSASDIERKVERLIKNKRRLQAENSAIYERLRKAENKVTLLRRLLASSALASVLVATVPFFMRYNTRAVNAMMRATKQGGPAAVPIAGRTRGSRNAGVRTYTALPSKPSKTPVYSQYRGNTGLVPVKSTPIGFTPYNMTARGRDPTDLIVPGFMAAVALGVGTKLLKKLRSSYARREQWNETVPNTASVAPPRKSSPGTLTPAEIKRYQNEVRRMATMNVPRGWGAGEGRYGLHNSNDNL